MDTQKFINELAQKWSAKYPQQEARILRGAALALSGKISPRSLNSWRVVGSKGEVYTVAITCGYPSCTCPDATRRELRCKHMWSAALLTRLATELEAFVAESAKAAKVKREAAPSKRPLAEGLSDLCAKIHNDNHARLQSLPHSQDS
jgi:hypothetical protein